MQEIQQVCGVYMNNELRCAFFIVNQLLDHIYQIEGKTLKISNLRFA
jgi:hypothetical protein